MATEQLDDFDAAMAEAQRAVAGDRVRAAANGHIDPYGAGAPYYIKAG
jgi:hypothetical protein